MLPSKFKLLSLPEAQRDELASESRVFRIEVDFDFWSNYNAEVHFHCNCTAHTEGPAFAALLGWKAFPQMQ